MMGITKRDIILIILAVAIGELVRRFITMAAKRQAQTRGRPTQVASAFPAEVGPGLSADGGDFVGLDQLDMGDIGSEMQR